MNNVDQVVSDLLKKLPVELTKKQVENTFKCLLSIVQEFFDSFEPLLTKTLGAKYNLEEVILFLPHTRFDALTKTSFLWAETRKDMSICVNEKIKDFLHDK